jgi:hypothetical protein
LANHSTNPQILEAMGPFLTHSMFSQLLEDLVSATPHDKATAFGTLARTLSEERRRELVQLLQRTPPSVRAWGLAALAPSLAGTPDDELLRLVWEELQRGRDENEVSELFSLLLGSAPDSWVPGLFERVAQEGFIGTGWFVSLAVASIQRAPVLIGQAIHAAGALKNPWKHFRALALRISELPLSESLQGMRSLLLEAQKRKEGREESFIAHLQTLAEFADRPLHSADIANAQAMLEMLRKGSTSGAFSGRGEYHGVDFDLEVAGIGEGHGLDPIPMMGMPLRPTEADALRALDELERSLPPAEPVLLGISVPVKVSPGDEFTARFVACVERLEREVAAKLELLGLGANTAIGFQRCQWQLGSRFRVRVTSPHLIVSPEEQEFVWNADASVLDFGVRVPPKARGRRTSLQFEVFLDGARVALLRHDLSVALMRRQAGKRRVQLGRAPRTAFASFASKDRNRVLDRIASLRLAAGLDVFMDCLSLRPGEEFKKSLLTEIQQRELFLLFWSRNALASQWVEWEWRTALRVKKREAIQPHPLEPVAVAPPPKELAMLHFGDVYMLVREG